MNTPKKSRIWLMFILTASIYGLFLSLLGGYATVILGIVAKWMAGSIFQPLSEGGWATISEWLPAIAKFALVTAIIALIALPQERRSRARNRNDYLERAQRRQTSGRPGLTDRVAAPPTPLYSGRGRLLRRTLVRPTPLETERT